MTKLIKNPLASKTIWFNTLTIITVVATFFGYTPDQEVAVATSNLLLALSPVVNLVLRYVTTQPIK